MNWKTLTAAAAAVSFGVSLAAQSCPRERTQDVPMSISYGPPQNCGSVNYSFGGITVTSGKNGCPLFALLTPRYQTAVPATTNTMVEVIGTVPVTIHYFQCVTDWLIFIPIGSSCVFDRMVNLYTENQLRTIPCPTATTPGNPQG